jgi:hypothetical protein
MFHHLPKIAGSFLFMLFFNKGLTVYYQLQAADRHALDNMLTLQAKPQGETEKSRQYLICLRANLLQPLLANLATWTNNQSVLPDFMLMTLGELVGRSPENCMFP